MFLETGTAYFTNIVVGLIQAKIWQTLKQEREVLINFIPIDLLAILQKSLDRAM